MTVDLKTIVQMQMAEIDRLRAEIDRQRLEIDGLVGWITGDADALACLQAIYANPRSTEANKLKAAAAAIAYERSKPASVVVQVDFRERVRAARLKQMELDRREWAKLDQPQKSLDLAGPTPPTFLGGFGEPDPAA